MLNIVICEDNNTHKNHIENIIKSELLDLKLQSEIELSSDNPVEIIRYLENNSNNHYIYFLDVALNAKINGIELAKNIRKLDPSGYIIFITSHAEMSLLTFQYKVQALDYILKSNLETLKLKIRECLIEINNNLQNAINKHNDYLTISSGSTFNKVQLDTILFIETTQTDHKLRLHTIDERIEFYGKISELESKVPSNFYRTHRSYLINTNKIKAIDKENNLVKMINDET